MKLLYFTKKSSLPLRGLFFLFSFLIVTTLQAQTVSGIVFDDGGNPLGGASIQNKRTGTGTSSGIDGAYAIAATIGDSLIYTSVGYKRNAAKVASSSQNIVLATEVGTLSDVVVVGYGTQRKGDVTVSIDKVNMGDLGKAPVRSFDEALAGRVAGVQVASSTGQPGAGTEITIRGKNSITQTNAPLYIIDGFPVEGADNNLLNPSDIESIEVLKDASATAIYGSRGSNGVIMITTKKGKEGPPVVQLNASYGVQKVTKVMDMMDPYNFVVQQIERDTTTNNTSNPTYVYLTKPERTLDYYTTAKNIDWQRSVLHTAPMQDYTLSLTGGSQNTKYAISGNILNQDGIIINSNYLRYQGRVALDQNINKKFRTGINANYTFTKQTGIAPSQSNNSATTNIMYSVWGYRPVEGADVDISNSLFDEDVSGANDYRVNPVLNLNNLYRAQKIKNLYANAYLDYNILPGLKFRVTGGVTSYNRRSEAFNNSNTQYGNIRQPNKVNGGVDFYERNTWINENILSYNKKFGQHNLGLTGVVSMQSSNYNIYGIAATQLPNESLGLSGLDEGTVQTPTAYTSDWAMRSYVGRFNYNYKSLYYLTGSFRSDGSSRFFSNHRWGYFPAISAAWRFYNEDFVKNLKVFSDGKLRLGWGQNGNNRVGDFDAYSVIAMPISMSYPINNTPIRGAGPTAIGNPDLKWETTEESNIGLDLGFLKNKITITVEAYRKKTKDLLLQADLPPSTGYPSAFKNIGSVQNEGLEFTLNTKNINSENFQWLTSFNIAFNRNKVLGLNEGQNYMLTNIRWDNNWQNVPAYIAKVGQPIGQMYGFISDGVYQLSDFNDNGNGTYTLKDDVTSNGNSRANIKPGDIKYKDLNNDKLINSADYTTIGNGSPKHQGGLNNNFTYKNFDLNIFFQWSYGNDVLNVNRLVFEGNALNKSYLNQFASYSDRWSITNQQSTNFRTGGYYGGGYASRYVEDASYLRLKTVSIGYNIPKMVLNKTGIKSARVYASGQNLITWTNYTGMDPEVNTYSSALTPGFDWSAYPRAKTFTMGINLTF